MSKAVDSLPSHLNQFIDQQNYSKYTPRDHAVWRYILKQNVSYFANRGFAVAEYAKGLNLTGISLEKIPLISDMDASLDKFGWGAIPVCGFIPPVAFLEFQSYGVLPIAHNMRSLEHIGYTPAPDIVHESAGHAPILVNEIYADYLKKYAHIAGKAISSKKYVQQYEAIRKLSDLKELAGVAKAEIEKAEEKLNQLSGKSDDVSESSQVVRLYWWTAEYGLFGDMNAPKVFGAGLLSSVDESQNCLRKEIKKIPFSIEAINYSYDITKPQPQLFVVRKFEDLINTLDDMEKLLSYRIGGEYGLNKAKASESVVTIQWENGAFYSGKLLTMTKLLSNVQLLSIEGPCQIGYGTEIMEDNFKIPSNQFLVPVGLPLKIMGNGIVTKINLLKIGDKIRFDFGEELTIDGKLQAIKRNNNSIGILKLQEVILTFKGKIFKNDTLYLPIGEKITSVYGGPFQQSSFENYHIGKASSKPIAEIAYSEKTLYLFASYEHLHNLKNNMKPSDFKRLCSYIDNLFEKFPNEWLLWLEILQMLKNNKSGNIDITSMIQELNQRIESTENNLTSVEKELLKKGLRVLNDF